MVHSSAVHFLSFSQIQSARTSADLRPELGLSISVLKRVCTHTVHAYHVVLMCIHRAHVCLLPQNQEPSIVRTREGNEGAGDVTHRPSYER